MLLCVASSPSLRLPLAGRTEALRDVAAMDEVKAAAAAGAEAAGAAGAAPGKLGAGRGTGAPKRLSSTGAEGIGADGAERSVGIGTPEGMADWAAAPVANRPASAV